MSIKAFDDAHNIKGFVLRAVRTEGNTKELLGKFTDFDNAIQAHDYYGEQVNKIVKWTEYS